MSKSSRFLSLLLTLIMILSTFAFELPSVAAETCVVSFDANGGTGMPAAVSVSAGTIITLPASAPKRPGMVFRGWSFTKDQADRGEIIYAANTTPEIQVNNSAILFASWAYEVTLHPGTQGWGSTQTLYKFPAVDLALFHHKNDIQPNYGMLPGVAGDVGRLDVFVEWNTNQLPNGKGNGTAYHEAYTANAPATLYAVWGNPIVYNADGGTFPMTGTDIQEEFVVGHSSSVTDSTKFGYFNLPRLDNAPVKAGCRLFKNSEGEVLYARVFKDGRIFRLENHETWLDIPIFNTNGYSWDAFYTTHTSYGETALELYAIWEPSVTYKANGGSGKDIVEYMTFRGTILYDFNDYTIQNNSFTNDSAFIGWNTKPDGSGTSYKEGEVISGYKSSEPIVLYAQWEKPSVSDKEYTVSFNAMEGYLAFEDQARNISYGQSYSTIDIPTPEYNGYIFEGWYNEETDSYLLENEIYSLTKDTSFTAKWRMHDNHVLECFKLPSNCWDEGYYTTSCAGCGQLETINYAKASHQYSNWMDTGDGEKVKRVCVNCLAEEGSDSTTRIKQDVIAYVNRSGSFGNSDFQYIDVANYIGAVIDGGVGEAVFQGDYFSNAVSIRNRARSYNPDIKYVLTVYNGNVAKFESWLQSASSRAAFADNLVNTVYAYGFDGLDIDFEFPQNMGLKTAFAQLLGEIRARFNIKTAQTGHQYILSIATPASVWSYTKFDLPACSQYLDYFNIMNYDLYCGSAFPYTHHHTPPYDNQDPFGHILTGGSVQSDITLYKSLGIPAEKIVPGMGMYSREWTNVANVNNGLFMSGSLQESNFHYDRLMSEYVNRNGFTRYWDDNSKAPYLYNPYSGRFLSYEDKDSIKYKCEIVSRERVRGIMIFDYITCDSVGVIGYIESLVGSVPHSCVPGRIEQKVQSCTEPGYEITYCSICDAVMTSNIIYNEGHYCTDWSVTTEPTKEGNGVLSGACLFCGTQVTKQTDPIGYTVTFDPGGGTINSSTKYIIQKGETYASVFGGSPAATKEGETFYGWYCDSQNYLLDLNDTFNFTSDITFTAKWDGIAHEHSYTAVTQNPTCTDEGKTVYKCSCGKTYTETIPALGHTWGEWTVTSKPTATEEGAKQRACTVCGATETESIPATGYVTPAEITATDMTVTVTNAQNVDTIKYASGRHLTIESIEAAGATTIADVASKATDGIFTVELTEEGTYTFA
ncbi:MAG: InlB B-repeat-containing protein, partial [Clostridia bacterium]|nr:InlB B-repeat-containing protein [Clostridia bacterium]